MCNIVFLSVFTFNSMKLKNETNIRKISFFIQVSSAYYLQLNILFVLIFSRQNCLFGKSSRSLRVLLTIKKKVGFLEKTNLIGESCVSSSFLSPALISTLRACLPGLLGGPRPGRPFTPSRNRGKSSCRPTCYSNANIRSDSRLVTYWLHGSETPIADDAVPRRKFSFVTANIMGKWKLSFDDYRIWIFLAFSWKLWDLWDLTVGIQRRFAI